MNHPNNYREAVRRTDTRQIKSDYQFRIASRIETGGRSDLFKVDHDHISLPLVTELKLHQNTVMRVPLIFAFLVLVAGNAGAVGHQPVRHPYRRHWKESLT